MPPSLTAGSPFGAQQEGRWYAFAPGDEPTFKEMELRGVRYRIRRQHANADHTWTDVDGGETEMLGRDPEVIEIETVWAGDNWQQRFADACWVFKSEKDAGILTIPDGPALDAKWIGFDEDRDLKKAGTKALAVFRESQIGVSMIVPEPDPRSVIQQSVPALDAAALQLDIAAYQLALELGVFAGQVALRNALDAFDAAVVARQALVPMDTEADVLRYSMLTRMRASAIRSYPGDAVNVRALTLLP